ncbi:unnamed protein product [Rotaria sp. Silwood2]|nr:unnamed protein product [Rotaria sp. Silwood2]
MDIPRILVIPEQHQAIFSLTINGTNPPKFYSESITFETHYQTLKLDIQYQIINGSLEFINKTPIHIDVFPNRLGTADIFLQNKFDEPINVTRIDFITYGICFSFIRNNTTNGHVELEPHKIQQVCTIKLSNFFFNIEFVKKNSRLQHSKSFLYGSFDTSSENKDDTEIYPITTLNI